MGETETDRYMSVNRMALHLHANYHWQPQSAGIRGYFNNLNTEVQLLMGFAIKLDEITTSVALLYFSSSQSLDSI